MANQFELRLSALSVDEQVQARQILQMPITVRLLQVVGARRPDLIDDSPASAKDAMTVALNAAKGAGWEKALKEIYNVANEGLTPNGNNEISQTQDFSKDDRQPLSPEFLQERK